MATDERIQVYEHKMTKTLESLTKELVTIRAGRANPHILDKTYRRLLWNTNTTSAGGKYYSSRSKNDSNSALGIIFD